MIYYWPGEDHNRPSGGVRTHYDHVRQLRAAGFDASVFHLTPGFQCTWFSHDVPIAYAPDVEMGPGDVLVMNEILGPQTASIAPGITKVIFAQNVHYPWRGWTSFDEPPPQTYADIVATIVLTEYEAEHFRWVYPEHPVYVVKHGIDGTLYVPRRKKKQIAFMPRKHADEAQAVFGWLYARGLLRDWAVVPIHGMDERQVAEVLGESAVFFAFGYPEGGTLPPFEATLAGCTVIGYGGFASDALMDACGGWLVPSGDTCTFARVADEVLRMPLERLVIEGLENRDLALEVFSPEQERAALVDAWTKILSP